jgi:hypothetical protein
MFTKYIAIIYIAILIHMGVPTAEELKAARERYFFEAVEMYYKRIPNYHALASRKDQLIQWCLNSYDSYEAEVSELTERLFVVSVLYFFDSVYSDLTRGQLPRSTLEALGDSYGVNLIERMHCGGGSPISWVCEVTMEDLDINRQHEIMKQCIRKLIEFSSPATKEDRKSSYNLIQSLVAPHGKGGIAPHGRGGKRRTRRRRSSKKKRRYRRSRRSRYRLA